MTAIVLRSRTRWVGISYALLWGPLWLFYERLNQRYTTATVGNIPAGFWVFASLYFAVDVLLVLGLNLLGRVASKEQVDEPFWHLASEILPIWFLFHILLLCIGHPVSDRLESSGLGAFETIVFVAALVAVAAFIARGVAKGQIG